MKKEKLKADQPNWEIKGNFEIDSRKMGEEFYRRHQKSLKAKDKLIEIMKKKIQSK